jgi:hypothetical protein
MTFLPNDSGNVSVGTPMPGGAIFVAPIGTAVPTDASTQLAEVYQNLGFISDAGLTESKAEDRQSFKDWGGQEVENVQTGVTNTWTFTPIETNKVVLGQLYGSDNIEDTTGGYVVAHKSTERANFIWIFEILLKNGKKLRKVIPNAKITAVGDITYNKSTLVGGQLTLNGFPDNEGVVFRDYYAEPADADDDAGSELPTG